jgi:cell division protein FtsW (lipid II flippase)
MSPHSRRHRSRRRRDAEAEEIDLPRLDFLDLLPRLASWLLLGLFLLLLIVAPLPLGANRVWAWAPMVVFLGLLAIPIALGLGDSAGFRVTREERWPLLVLLVCGVMFAFVGILQMSPPRADDRQRSLLRRARSLLGQAHDIVPTLSVAATRDTLLRCLGMPGVRDRARPVPRSRPRAVAALRPADQCGAGDDLCPGTADAHRELLCRGLSQEDR